MYDGDESEGPKGTFEIYKAEADSLFKQGEYKKSIDSYTIVSYTLDLSLFHYRCSRHLFRLNNLSDLL